MSDSIRDNRLERAPMSEPFSEDEYLRIEHALSVNGPALFDRDYMVAAQRLLAGCRQYRQILRQVTDLLRDSLTYLGELEGSSLAQEKIDGALALMEDHTPFLDEPL